jgi:hypothetical protein
MKSEIQKQGGRKLPLARLNLKQVSGVPICRSEKTSNEINLSNFLKGIYFVKIYDGENIHTGEIVTQ